MAVDKKLLGIYLNDHLAGSTVGRELAKRAAGANGDNDFGPFLERLLRELVEDRDTLLELMRGVGVRQDPVKRFVPLVAERAGRLKLNGSLFGYSPLSRLVELEGLSLGVEGKLAMWVNLGALPQEGGLEKFDLHALAERARAQRQGLEEKRIEAARIAFGG
jgi:hypothetical protein